MLKFFLIILFLFSSYAAFAEEERIFATPLKSTKEKDEKLMKDALNKENYPVFLPRKSTPSRFFSADLSMPDSFITSNNLIKKTGSFYRAFGEVIFVQGTLSDSFGVPISGAIIEIWQTNAAGKYHTLLEPDSEYIDKYFSMSGRTITDNLGNYHFITIMPGSVPGRAPHINMNVYHQKFGRLETEMYFEDHPYNNGDYQYLAYNEEERKMLTANVFYTDILNQNSIKLCTFNMVMTGIHKNINNEITKTVTNWRKY
jgi:protocatechuate 3,4-dioxygenase beta subunit